MSGRVEVQIGIRFLKVRIVKDNDCKDKEGIRKQ
jgi:hypothetical protein